MFYYTILSGDNFLLKIKIEINLSKSKKVRNTLHTLIEKTVERNLSISKKFSNLETFSYLFRNIEES